MVAVVSCCLHLYRRRVLRVKRHVQSFRFRPNCMASIQMLTGSDKRKANALVCKVTAVLGGLYSVATWTMSNIHRGVCVLRPLLTRRIGNSRNNLDEYLVPPT